MYRDSFSDSYSSFPLRALSFAHALGDAAGSYLPPQLVRALTASTILYGGLASYSRKQRASDVRTDV